MKRAVKNRKDSKHYHFIGIGGMGMGNLALLMLAKGYTVSGSDQKEGELTRRLRQNGATVFIGHDVRHIEGADYVVYSSAVKADNPEMFQSFSRHIPVLRRAELLAQLVNKEVGITVAGAHGKTTTSSLASYLLINAGLKPTTAVGGIVHQGDYNATLGIGRHMVAEVDESDGSFLYFSPHFSIITNMDFEHVDFYHTWDNIFDAYTKFVNRTVANGLLIICGDDKHLPGIVAASSRRFTTYGFGRHNAWVASKISLEASGSSFDCHYQGELIKRFELGIPGEHNVQNSLAVIALGHALKIDLAVIEDTLKTFRGVRRRFEHKGEAGGVLVIDDYGHHPTEIAATLQTAVTLDRRRIIVVFQPHRYSRTKFLMDGFAGCFGGVDHLILMDIYAASEKPIEGITTAVLMEKIRQKQPLDILHLEKGRIVDHLLGIVRPGDVVLTLGAGDVTHISDELAKRLAARQSQVREFGCVGVIMGGCSSEREVSLRSGAAVFEALSQAGCDVKRLDLASENHDEVREWIRDQKIDTAFIALHGRFGEDGGIQKVLEELDIPYNGCDPVASAAAFHKGATQQIFEAHDIITPKTLLLSGSGIPEKGWAPQAFGGFPLVVKPACEGSSIGVNLAVDHEGLMAALRKAREYGQEVVVQQYVKGRELTVGFVGEQVLPVVEICASDTHGFFDFQAKYKSQDTRYTVPADLSSETALLVQAEALKAYRAVGCDGFGRVDVLLGEDGQPYVLEINTIPGFTATSLLPKAARAAGLDFVRLCLTLLDLAYGKKKTNTSL